MDRSVALQDPDGFVNFEPLPLSPCGNIQEKEKLANTDWQVNVCVAIGDYTQNVGSCLDKFCYPLWDSNGKLQKMRDVDVRKTWDEKFQKLFGNPASTLIKAR